MEGLGRQLQNGQRHLVQLVLRMLLMVTRWEFGRVGGLAGNVAEMSSRYVVPTDRCRLIQKDITNQATSVYNSCWVSCRRAIHDPSATPHHADRFAQTTDHGQSVERSNNANKSCDWRWSHNPSSSPSSPAAARHLTTMSLSAIGTLIQFLSIFSFHGCPSNPFPLSPQYLIYRSHSPFSDAQFTQRGYGWNRN